LEHASSKSSAFKSKVAAMRAYGLTQGRGQVRVTEIGEKIARHRNEKEYNEAIIDAINNIRLWNVLFERYTKRGKELTTKELWLELESECGLPPKPAQDIAPQVLKEYTEDVRAIRDMPSSNNTEQEMMVEQTQNPQGISETKPTEGLIDYGYGKYKVYLPEDEEEAKTVWVKIKKMVDSVYGEK
jgi:hypothetical protein